MEAYDRAVVRDEPSASLEASDKRLRIRVSSRI